MNSIHCKLKDLGSSFKKFQAIESGEKRKQERLRELETEFLSKGKSLWMAQQLAIEKYNLIHKNN